MKITIDVSDFYLEENELEQGLKNHITNDVVSVIKKEIKEKIETQITNHIRKEFDLKLENQIQSVVSELMPTTKIKNPDSYNQEKPTLTLQEYVVHQLEKNSNWSSPKDQIEKLATKWGDEMRNRYDFHFASQIVIKMGEQGMLKDGVIDSLLIRKE